MVVWDVVNADARKIVFRYRSEDGEQGFPGALDVELTYELDDDGALTVTHTATTDKRTVVNLTHHSFFNLHGAGVGTVNDHYLTICADGFTPVDAALIPTAKSPRWPVRRSISACRRSSAPVSTMRPSSCGWDMAYEPQIGC